MAGCWGGFAWLVAVNPEDVGGDKTSSSISPPPSQRASTPSCARSRMASPSRARPSASARGLRRRR
eukprot:13148220-Alexandrium_andersonii.AAC.1